MEKYISYKNRGMLLENLINNSINYYIKKQIAFFAKNNLNIKFRNITTSYNKSAKTKIELNSSFIKGKSTVDYYGTYNGKYITFEAKSTNENAFLFSNIKYHQHQHLKLIKKLKGEAFYIIFFKSNSKVLKLDVDDIDYENMKKISYEEASQIGIELEIIFPGIIDFLNVL